MVKRLPYHDWLHAEIEREWTRLSRSLMFKAAPLLNADPFALVYDTLYSGLEHACGWFPGAGQRFQ